MLGEEQTLINARIASTVFASAPLKCKADAMDNDVPTPPKFQKCTKSPRQCHPAMFISRQTGKVVNTCLEKCRRGSKQEIADAISDWERRDRKVHSSFLAIQLANTV